MDAPTPPCRSRCPCQSQTSLCFWCLLLLGAHHLHLLRERHLSARVRRTHASLLRQSVPHNSSQSRSSYGRRKILASTLFFFWSRPFLWSLLPRPPVLAFSFLALALFFTPTPPSLLPLPATHTPTTIPQRKNRKEVVHLLSSSFFLSSSSTSSRFPSSPTLIPPDCVLLLFLFFLYFSPFPPFLRFLFVVQSPRSLLLSTLPPRYRPSLPPPFLSPTVAPLNGQFPPSLLVVDRRPLHPTIRSHDSPPYLNRTYDARLFCEKSITLTLVFSSPVIDSADILRKRPMISQA